jgi:nicotinic acid phosphoribosyltransferase
MDIGETVIPRIRGFPLLAGCIFIDGNCCDTIILEGITTPAAASARRTAAATAATATTTATATTRKKDWHSFGMDKNI